MPRHLEIAVDFVDVKMDAIAIMDGTLDVDISRELRHGAVPQLTGKDALSMFYGGTPAQTRDWIRNGYDVGTKQAPASSAPRKRTRWREEGDDLDIQRAWSGDPTPFSRRETGVKQGVRIEFDADFSASTPARVIEDFGRWLATLTAGYAASGHDLEVIALYPGTGLYEGRGAPTSQLFKVALKRFGQQTDFVAWSPLFSPTGFRHLIFSMWSVYGARKGWRTKVGYGYGDFNSKSWGAEFDPLTSTLHISSPYMASSFDADAMTEQVNRVFTA